jgi:hypothetical protein
MQSLALFAQHLELKNRFAIACCVKIGCSQSSISVEGRQVPELLVSRIEELH